MDNIKKYKHVQDSNNSLTFDIKRMEEVYDQTGGQADDPHRHDYYIVLIVIAASGKHIIDFNEFDLTENQVYFISPGQVHQIIEQERSEGYILTFTPQFMMENGIEDCFIEDLYLFQDSGYAPPLELNEEELQQLAALAEEIQIFAQTEQKFKYQAIGALLKLLLIRCNNLCSIPVEGNTQIVQASVSLLRNFKTLLEEHHQQWHKVSEYAQQLNITPDHLNTSVKSLTGKTAKEHIQSRLVIAAKRLLLFSSLNTKEIAYQLGFSEPAHFSQFFKKRTGTAPSRFGK